FYFLEMNTRLQVEHPVTELVYGIDLVEWQLRIAQGEKLPLSQDAILARRNGHAIEVRLCAESPANNFMPQTGQVLAWHVPVGEGMRVDHGLKSGQVISPFYDSMQAKLIAHAPTREQARRKLLKMLGDTVLLGVASNRDFLERIIAHEAFAGGDFSTAFIGRHFPAEVIKTTEKPGLRHTALAAALLYQTDALRLQTGASLATGVLSWFSSNPAPAQVKLRCHEQEILCQVLARPNGEFEMHLAHDGQPRTLHLTLTAVGGHDLHYVCEGVQGRAFFARHQHGLWLCSENETHAYTDATYEPAKTAEAGSDGRLTAPMDGRIIAVNVKHGDAVRKGQTLVVLEAMKMEFQVTAGVEGSVESVNCALGAQVSARQLLVSIAPAGG
ncbi:MAG: biotin/lipoyl-containing protein, partial [Nevskiales bacterium]